MQDFLIAGCGYVGERLALALPDHTLALVRSRGRADELAAAGIDAASVDLDAPEAGPAWSCDIAGCVLFYLVPPPGDNPADPRLRALLGALSGVPARLVYMSTTGVYGDTGGASVDEDTTPNPATDRARARFDAECAVRDWAQARGCEWVILRVPGIYGPGRLPLERIRSGQPSIRESEAGPGNRIHVDDLVRVCVAAGASPAAADRLYNVGDGNHASTTEYFRTVARQAGLAPPPEVSREEARRGMSALAWSFLGDSRRVDTGRLERELAVEISYRSLEDGVRASLQQEGSG
jgi:nucleoside-diphosphate-sugar epimerase